MEKNFNVFLLSMTTLAVIVFISLYFVDMDYGRLCNRKCGKSINKKLVG